MRVKLVIIGLLLSCAALFVAMFEPVLSAPGVGDPTFIKSAVCSFVELHRDRLIESTVTVKLRPLFGAFEFSGGQVNGGYEVQAQLHRTGLYSWYQLSLVDQDKGVALATRTCP